MVTCFHTFDRYKYFVLVIPRIVVLGFLGSFNVQEELLSDLSNVYKPCSRREANLRFNFLYHYDLSFTLTDSIQLCAFGVTPGHRLISLNYSSPELSLP